MSKEDFVLAVMSPASGDPYSPVQIQKLLFLVDRRVSPELVGGRHFNFYPHHYGPFDKSVYSTLKSLHDLKMVTITDSLTNYRDYALTPRGLEVGRKEFRTFPRNVRSYIRKISRFVRDCSFSQLLSAIYSAYPEMRENSVFQNQ